MTLHLTISSMSKKAKHEDKVWVIFKGFHFGRPFIGSRKGQQFPGIVGDIAALGLFKASFGAACIY